MNSSHSMKRKLFTNAFFLLPLHLSRHPLDCVCSLLVFSLRLAACRKHPLRAECRVRHGPEKSKAGRKPKVKRGPKPSPGVDPKLSKTERQLLLSVKVTNWTFTVSCQLRRRIKRKYWLPYLVHFPPAASRQVTLINAVQEVQRSK